VSDSLQEPFRTNEITNWSANTFNEKGTVLTFTQNVKRFGSNQATIEIPENWYQFTELQRAEYLSSFYYVLKDGRVVLWKDLPSDARVDLVAIGRTSKLPGNDTVLRNMTVRILLDTVAITERKKTQLNSRGLTAGTQEFVTENNLRTERNWNVMDDAFNQRGQALKTKEITRGPTGEETTSFRDAIQYDLHNRTLSYDETSTTNTSDIQTKQSVSLGYDALGRLINQDRTVREKSLRTGGIDRFFTVVLRGITYDRYDRQTGFDQIQFDGDTVRVGGATYKWDELFIPGLALSAHDRQLILNGKALADQLVNVTSMRGIHYDLGGSQAGYLRVEKQAGRAGAEMIESAQTSVRAGTQYYTFGNQAGLASGYKEITKTNAADLQTVTQTRGIEYEMGRQASLSLQAEQIGKAMVEGELKDINRQTKSLRHNIKYNEAGLQDSSIEDTIENGLRTTTITRVKAHDSKGRALETENTTVVEGEIYRTGYFFEGRELDPLALADILEKNPGISLENIITEAPVPHRVSEITTSIRKNIVYDSLDRQVAYDDETLNPGGVRTFTKTDNITFDMVGRQTAFRTETKTEGWTLTYYVDGVELDAKTLIELLETDGLTLWQALATGRVATSRTRTALSKPRITERSDIRYDKNGNAAYYKERTVNIDAGLFINQDTIVIQDYNEFNKVGKQLTTIVSDTGVIGDNGTPAGFRDTQGHSETVTALEYTYDVNGNLTGGI
jgi:hypothetical protein